MLRAVLPLVLLSCVAAAAVDGETLGPVFTYPPEEPLEPSAHPGPELTPQPPVARAAPLSTVGFLGLCALTVVTYYLAVQVSVRAAAGRPLLPHTWLLGRCVDFAREHWPAGRGYRRRTGSTLSFDDEVEEKADAT
jgi:hypothetical protein